MMVMTDQPLHIVTELRRLLDVLLDHGGQHGERRRRRG
jgi:hypothetical protein